MSKGSDSPATKKDLQELERRLESRLEARLQQMEDRIMSRFDVLMENLVHDFRGAHQDKTSVHDDKLQDHDGRLLRLEQSAGFAAR